MSGLSEAERELFVVPEKLPVSKLEIREAFDGLTEKEKAYAHWISKASWEGWPICLHQTSIESPQIFSLFQLLFKSQSISSLRDAALEKGVTEEEFKWFLQYAAQFYGNMGNFLSFGDTKFIPRLPVEKFDLCVKSCSLEGNLRKKIDEIYAECRELIYSLDIRLLGLPNEGNLSTYIPKTASKTELELTTEFLKHKSLSPYNTRLSKDDDVLIVEIASEIQTEEKEEEFLGSKFQVRYGLYSEFMGKIAKCLGQAASCAANETQMKMMESYVEFFTSGDIKKHKEAQRHWVRDICPVVECNIGFIESYRDPMGIRGEFEGFVAVVNKETSKKFAELVAEAPKFLSTLPWPQEFEKDKFLKPDFTSLEIISFCTSGIPIGINIPNYDDIRQDFGFKNVSLQNILAAREVEEKFDFFVEEDHDLYRKYKAPGLAVIVAGHELLGHGSGKTLKEDVDGNKNFDPSLVNPVTNSQVANWYKPGQTYDSQFGTFGSSFEECRAECVGLVLSTNKEFLKVFGHEGEEADDITYACWLHMVEAGVRALQFYNVEKSKWGQAHMMARYAIMRTLLNGAEGFLTIDTASGNAKIRLDRSKILSVGVPVINKFLQKIQICRSTADVALAKEFYIEDITVVTEEFQKLRDIVLANKKPRRVFCRVHTELQDGKVVLKEYEATLEGVIESFSSQWRDE